jgi:Flp pilus assembly protein TadB
MNLESFFLHLILAAPVLVGVLLCWVLFSTGIAYILAIAITAVGTWWARGCKDAIDRDYRARTWKP